MKGGFGRGLVAGTKVRLSTVRVCLGREVGAGGAGCVGDYFTLLLFGVRRSSRSSASEYRALCSQGDTC